MEYTKLSVAVKCVKIWFEPRFAQRTTGEGGCGSRYDVEEGVFNSDEWTMKSQLQLVPGD